MENNQSTMKTSLLVAGAFASYIIGSGFASGQETLQYFGSYGVPGFIISLLASAIFIAATAGFCYVAGQKQTFPNSKEVYQHFCGKGAGFIIDVFALLLTFGIMISMFAGSGATINQYFGIPNVVGSIAMGCITGLVAIGGLKRIVQVLGCLGVIIIGYVAVIGITALVMRNADFVGATANLPTLIEEGLVLQPAVFGITTNPILSGLNYGGVVLITGVPFYVALGQRASSPTIARNSAIFSSAFVHIGMLAVVCGILLNLDAIFAGGVVQIPNLAALKAMIPAIEWTFAVILVCGIFTSITAYLWYISGRFAEEGTKKSKIIIAVLIVAGIFGSTLIPFNEIINILFPIAGYAGWVVMIFMIIKAVMGSKEKAA